MINWNEHPRYQRALLKLRRMTPDQKAIVNTAMLDESFGDVESRKMIQSTRLGAEKKYRKKQLALRAKTQTQRYELGKEELTLGKERFESRMRAEQSLLGLRREQFEFGKKQLPISTALGVAGIGVSGLIGWQGMKQKQKMAKAYLDIARMMGTRSY